MGLGRFGSSLAIELNDLGCDVLAVDTNPRVTQELAERLPQVVTTDGSSVASLVALGAESFDTAVVGTGADFESSVMVTATLKHDFKVRRVIAKAVTPRQRDILLRVGADEVVLPEHETGVRLAHQLNAQLTARELQEIHADLNIGRVVCPAILHGKSIAEAELRSKHKLNLLMVKGDRSILHPQADELLRAGDILVLHASREDIERFAQLSPR